MSELGDPTKVPALLALLAPGFIILWFRTRLLEGATPDFKQQVFYFAIVSAANSSEGEMSDQKTGYVLAKDDYTLMQKGHTPRKVQGGFVPGASSGATPPKGGSGARPPKK